MKNGAAQVLEYVPFGTFQLPHVVFHVVLVAQSKKKSFSWSRETTV